MGGPAEELSGIEWVTGQQPLPFDDDLPGVCPDCYEDDHCGDDRCPCCEEAAALGARLVTLQPMERYL